MFTDHRKACNIVAKRTRCKLNLSKRCLATAIDGRADLPVAPHVLKPIMESASYLRTKYRKRELSVERERLTFIFCIKYVPRCAALLHQAINLRVQFFSVSLTLA